MEAHIGVGTESGLVCTVIRTQPNIHDIKVSEMVANAEKTGVYAGAGYTNNFTNKAS